MRGAGVVVMGAVELVDASGRAHPVRGSRKRALLAALVLHRDRPVAPAVLADAVWGESVPPTAASALRVHLSELRRTLTEVDDALDDAIVTVDGGYQLVLGADRLDVGTFEDLLDRAATLGDDDPQIVPTLVDALDRWRGRPYGDLLDHARAADDATRLERRRAEAAARLARLALVRADVSLVATLGQQLRHGPHDESVAAAVVRLLHRDGRRDEALAVARDVRDRLVTDLDVEPGPELLAAEETARHETAGPDPVPWIRPVRATPLLGRDDELAAVRDRLDRPGVVTVVGPPGVGKTRLAEEAIGAAAEDAERPVLWLDAATVGPGADVATLAAAVLGLADQPFRTPAAVVADHLSATRPLVVVDNAEHVVASTSALLDALVPVVSGVLVTSRTPLDRADERVVRLDGLPSAGAGRELLLDGIDRAGGRTDPAEDDRWVRQICDAVDGLPLAIELAARTVAAYGPDVDAADVVSRLAVADADRQGSIAAAVAAGLVLHDAGEVEVFDRCGVFSGWFTAADASALTGSDAEPALVRLADHSLVATGYGPRGPRFRLLVPIREIARARLRATPEREAAVREGHARRVADEAGRAGRSLNLAGSADGRASLHELATELGVALDWFEEGHDPAGHIALLADLWLHWYLSGRTTEGRRRTEAGLARDGGLRAHRGDALAAASFLAWIQGDYGAVRRWVLAARELGASGSALPVRQLADATLAWIDHDLDAAEDHLARAMAELGGASGATLESSFVGSMWANVAWFRGRHDEAAERYAAAALAAERIGHAPPATLARRHEVLCLALAGAPAAAARIDQLLDGLDAHHDDVTRCQTRTLAGLALLALGQLDRATTELREGVAEAARLLDAVSLLLGTIGLVRLAAERGDHTAVARGLGWLDLALGLTGVPLPAVERGHLERAEALLDTEGSDDLLRLRADGRTLPAERLATVLTDG